MENSVLRLSPCQVLKTWWIKEGRFYFSSDFKAFFNNSMKIVKVKVAQPCPTLRPGDSPGTDTGECSLSLLRGIFPTQVSRIAGGFFTS